MGTSYGTSSLHLNVTVDVAVFVVRGGVVFNGFVASPRRVVMTTTTDTSTRGQNFRLKFLTLWVSGRFFSVALRECSSICL